jgi:hypothetical protein
MTKYQDILTKYAIPANYHAEFVRWVDLGEASDKFREYYNADDNCQSAVEDAFAIRQKRVQEVVQGLFEMA